MYRRVALNEIERQEGEVLGGCARGCMAVITRPVYSRLQGDPEHRSLSRLHGNLLRVCTLLSHLHYCWENSIADSFNNDNSRKK